MNNNATAEYLFQITHCKFPSSATNKFFQSMINAIKLEFRFNYYYFANMHNHTAEPAFIIPLVPKM